MRYKLIISLIFLCCALSSFACLNTYQFKLFPVGTYLDTIITVDVQIRRTSQLEGTRQLKLVVEDLDDMGPMWILNAFVSKYDNRQKILHKEYIGTTYSIGKHYIDSLQMLYSKAYESIESRYANLIKFKSTYISFCDFQQVCDLIKLSTDTVTNNNFIQYNNTNYAVEVFQDTSYYAFNKSAYHSHNILGLHANSIRVYETPNTTLVISHLATGHEIGMGWMTNDSKEYQERQAGDEPVTLSKEYKTEMDFFDLKEAVYEEPLLHHGYGVDLFIVAH